MNYEKTAWSDPLVLAEQDVTCRRALAGVVELRQRLADAEARQETIRAARDLASYDGIGAPKGSPEGRHLEKLRRDAADVEEEILDVRSAIRTAEQRVMAARDKAAGQARCADAQHALALVEEWEQAAVFCNEALTAFTARYRRVEEIADELFRLNVNAPRGELVRVNIRRAVSSELAPVGLGELLPPSQRTSIERLIEAWAERVEDRARRILGGEEEAAA